MSKVEEVNKQLHEIFSSENLKKDNFFRELVEKDSEGCKQKRSNKT
jgi:SWI/SNF-related matrix-associated actin-dependent regulator of chromatin subfamily A member 5